MEYSTKSLKEEVQEEIEEIQDVLEGIAKKIYDNPELKFEEYKASRWLSDELEGRGFDVERNLGGLETAFRGSYEGASEGPAVGFLCEYDALPGLGHGCGHNLIAAMGLGAGIGTSAVMDRLPGRIEVIGTPAEEGGGGKVDLLDQGIFQDLDAAMLVHPSDRVIVGRGSLAIREIKMDFYGESAHASSEPEKGINALDAAISTFNNINALREHVSESARIHGIITDGGQKPNIVPDHAGALFYVRAPDNEYVETLLEKVKDCARGGALAAGADLEFELQGHEYEPMQPNRVLIDLWSENLEQIGVEVQEPEGGLGSTDMGNVSQVVPTIHPYVKIVGEGTPHHSKAFAAAADSEEGYDAMLKGAKAMAMTAVDILSNPEKVEEMWGDFSP